MRTLRRYLLAVLMLCSLGALVPVSAADLNTQRPVQVDWRFVSPKPKGPDDPPEQSINLPNQVARQEMGSFNWVVNYLVLRLLGLSAW